ncbi:F-box protein CPR1-like [Salvia miltiorrhiza]|uniref:F-box protein CPR1-like n=1 Tax=Salvia miltiorrhiza TaxID=226208 RepID=UPI0025ACD198|nr:F-box protein CPR1-like [Salvia miltiorrhiza]
MDEERVNISPIDDPTDDRLMITTDLVAGCCNGLVCVINTDECRFFVSNTATRISIELPDIGLTYSSSSINEIRSSKTNSWKTVEHGSLDWHCSLGKFACGRLHWVAVSGGYTYIESFDLKTEVFGTMELPCKLQEGDGIRPWLCVIEGYLSVVCDDIGNGKRRVWVMKDYGVKESWVEVITQPSEKFTRCCKVFFYPESLVSPIPQKNLV